nr:transcriptional protein SWT1-like [Ciona intestinalis]|eukprot:XP_026693074.1 transcriptional protein SWT1-like [Ciona intestinalis]
MSLQVQVHGRGLLVPTEKSKAQSTSSFKNVGKKRKSGDMLEINTSKTTIANNKSDNHQKVKTRKRRKKNKILKQEDTANNNNKITNSSTSDISIDSLFESPGTTNKQQEENARRKQEEYQTLDMPPLIDVEQLAIVSKQSPKQSPLSHNTQKSQLLQNKISYSPSDLKTPTKVTPKFNPNVTPKFTHNVTPKFTHNITPKVTPKVGSSPRTPSSVTPTKTTPKVTLSRKVTSNRRRSNIFINPLCDDGNEDNVDEITRPVISPKVVRPIITHHKTPKAQVVKDKDPAEVEVMDTSDTIYNCKDIPKAIEEKESTPAITNAPPNANAILFIVVDTNILLYSSCLKDIDFIINWCPPPRTMFRRAVVVVPWVVLQELDHLKTNKQTAAKARRSIAFLNRHFSCKKPGIRGQTILEAAAVVDGLNIEINDDRLLQCCFFFSRLPGKHKTLLFTNDSNLANKAMINSFMSYSNLQALMKGVTEYTSLPNPVLDEEGSTKPVIPTPRGSSTSSIVEEDTPKSMVLQLSLEQMHLALCVILETEMREAYGRIWEEVVVKRPPWSLAGWGFLSILFVNIIWILFITFY